MLRSASAAAYLLILYPIALHHLGQHSYGVWVLGSSFAAYVSLLDVGIGEAAIQAASIARRRARVAEAQALVGSVVTLTVTGVIFGGSALALAGVLVSGVVTAPDTRLFLLTVSWGGLAVLVTTAMGILCAMLAGLSSFRVAYSITALSNTLAAVSAGLLVPLLPGALGLWSAAIIAPLVGFCLALVAAHGSVGGVGVAHFDLRLVRRLASFGLHVQMRTIGHIAQTSIDRIVVGAAFGPVAAGAYDLGARAASVLRSAVQPTLIPLLVHASQLSDEAPVAKLRALSLRVVELGVVVLVPVILVCEWFASAALRAWAGDVGELTILSFRVLLPAYALSVLGGMALMILEAQSRPGWNTRWAFGAVLLMPASLGLGLLGGHVDGAIVGAGIAVGAAAVIPIAGVTHLIFRRS